MHSGLLGTRGATSIAVDGFAGNMEVVREESGPTDRLCSGVLREGLESGVRWSCTGFRAKTVRYRRGLASSNIPDTFDRQGRRDSLGDGE
jgi:hypothetical protein